MHLPCNVFHPCRIRVEGLPRLAVIPTHAAVGRRVSERAIFASEGWPLTCFEGGHLILVYEL